MSQITNDQDFREALGSLSLEKQRSIGLLFACNIRVPGMEPGLEKALELALESENGAQERKMAYKAAKSAATRTYTACGSDADWGAQAEHFVAAACSAALTPEEKLKTGTNPAWKAAIQSRMANNCLMMESESSHLQNEAQRQYEICEEFLQANR